MQAEEEKKTMNHSLQTAAPPSGHSPLLTFNVLFKNTWQRVRSFSLPIDEPQSETNSAGGEQTATQGIMKQKKEEREKRVNFGPGGVSKIQQRAARRRNTNQTLVLCSAAKRKENEKRQEGASLNSRDEEVER